MESNFPDKKEKMKNSQKNNLNLIPKAHIKNFDIQSQ